MNDEIPFSGISPDEQWRRSFDRLRSYLEEVVCRYHPYYRRLFRKLEIDPAAIRTYDDFRRIPITTKDTVVSNLADFTLRPRYPGAGDVHDADEIDADSMIHYRAAAAPGYRDLFGVRSSSERTREQFLRDWRPIHFQMSGGTTGKAVVTGYTHTDL